MMDVQYIFHWLPEMSYVKDFQIALRLTVALYAVYNSYRDVCTSETFIFEKMQTESVVGELRLVYNWCQTVFTVLLGITRDATG